jgi:multiple sugar transport system permease protein/sn-glycerol 3-phosphate transport system permease protein
VVAALMLAPALVLALAFDYGPMAGSAVLAFYDWNLVSSNVKFVGLKNFGVVLNDPRFQLAVRNTVVYAGALIPLQVLLPLLMALALRPLSGSRLSTPYRVLLFTPKVISLATASVIWLWMLHPMQGVVNQTIVAFGGPQVPWLSQPATAIAAIILVATWKSLGFHLLLYLLALEAVPAPVREAARVDGASGWTLFSRIEWPLISPTFFFVLVTTVLFVNNEAFTAINVLTRGGPYSATSNVLFYLYERGFRFFQAGEASALALGLVVILFAITWLQFRLVGSRVHYG